MTLIKKAVMFTLAQEKERKEKVMRKLTSQKKIRIVGIMQFETIYPRDIIAALALIGAFVLLALGVDTFVAAITTAIIGYYFSKRVYEENN